MAIPKDQLRELFEATQPTGSKVRELVVRTKDGDRDFDELIVVVDVPIAIPAKKRTKAIE